MRFCQKWKGVRVRKNSNNQEFNAHVPGNIQLDYGEYISVCDMFMATCLFVSDTMIHSHIYYQSEHV